MLLMQLVSDHCLDQSHSCYGMSHSETMHNNIGYKNISVFYSKIKDYTKSC